MLTLLQKLLRKLTQPSSFAEYRRVRKNGILWMVSEYFDRQLTADQMEVLRDAYPCCEAEREAFIEGADDVIQMVRHVEENRLRISELLVDTMTNKQFRDHAHESG